MASSVRGLRAPASRNCGSSRVPRVSLADDNAPQVNWVAAESLDTALRYMRKRHDDFTITEVRFLGIIPLLSGSPLD